MEALRGDVTVTIEGVWAVVIAVLVLGGLAALVSWGYWLRATGTARTSHALGRGASRYSVSHPLVAWAVITMLMTVPLAFVAGVEMLVALLGAAVVCGAWVWWLTLRAGKCRAPEPSTAPMDEPSDVTCLTDDQAHEVARLTLAGYEVQGTRSDGSVELFRPGSWTHSESTTSVSPGGHRYGTLGANTYWLAVVPVILAATLGWPTLLLSVPIVVGYVWFRWQQHSEESKILPPREAQDIGQADAALRESGYGHESTRS